MVPESKEVFKKKKIDESILEGYSQLEGTSTGQSLDKINNDSIGLESIE